MITVLQQPDTSSKVRVGDRIRVKDLTGHYPNHHNCICDINAVKGEHYFDVHIISGVHTGTRGSWNLLPPECGYVLLGDWDE